VQPCGCPLGSDAALAQHRRPGEDGDWVVRTWTSTPPADRRPTGTPDVVHRVDEKRGELVAEQIPSGGDRDVRRAGEQPLRATGAAVPA
jgi:hypothetical protein